MSEKQAVRFAYVNWKGERSDRHVLPIRIWFGKTDWHPEECWL
jgi:predicted DNA-binding transcriptional regulator YafY